MREKAKDMVSSLSKRTPRWPLVGVVMIAVVLALVLWKIPEWQVPEGVTSIRERVDLENEFRKTLAQIVAGAVILTGVYYTARRVSATERISEAALKNVEVAQEGQITERFTRAIQHLGDDNMAVCLGGIYALERIAKDSPRDHWQVMEVLTAYIRVKAPKGGAEQKPDQLGWPINIQAVMTVLGRRNRLHENDEQHLDLMSTDLRQLRLHFANLERAELADADLEGADLIGANLGNATLVEANLKARLIRTNLERANLQKADLQGAALIDANLRAAFLVGANLSGANLNNADMREADLFQATLSGANLKGAKLTIEQLCCTRSLYGVIGLAIELVEEIKEKCPRLLEEPTGEG